MREKGDNMTTQRLVTHAGRCLVFGVMAMTVLLAQRRSVEADMAKCRVAIIRQLMRYEKAYLHYHGLCLEKENLGKIPGPCNTDPTTLLKVQSVNAKVVENISAKCTMMDIMALGYRSDCVYEAATTGIEATCAGLPGSPPGPNPITTVAEFVECMKCWKGAEASEFIALLFASHAVEECAGALDETSTRCSDLDCTTPLPDQRNLGDTGENDCQRAIGRKGIRYLVNRQKLFERCVLAGGTQASCLADIKLQVKLARLETSKQTGIQRKCGNRSPAPSVPFCCKNMMGNSCTLVATRTDCINGGGTVKEGQMCNAMTLNCDPLGGGGEITWWSNCPESDTCPGPALATRADLVACVDSSADRIVDELLCLQFPTTWTCPVDTP